MDWFDGPITIFSQIEKNDEMSQISFIIINICVYLIVVYFPKFKQDISIILVWIKCTKVSLKNNKK